MSPEAARASYRRAMAMAGEPVILRSAPIPNSTAPLPEGPTRARVMSYTTEEITGGITAANRKAIILHEDLKLTPYPNGPVKNAKIVWAGKVLTIVSVDNGTRRLAGVPIAYSCEVSGA